MSFAYALNPALTETAGRRWVKQAWIDQGTAPGLTSDERAELGPAAAREQGPARGARDPEKSRGLDPAGGPEALDELRHELMAQPQAFSEMGGPRPPPWRAW